jgi:hypothetical protein
MNPMTLGSKTLAGAAALLVALSTGAAAQDAPKPGAKLWAGLGVTSPVVSADEVTYPDFFMLFFTLVNDGDKTVNPEVDASQLLVNGKELKDWGFIIGNGPRGSDFEALPPGECLRFGRAMGRYFAEPRVYKVQWKGKAFESAEVVFRVLPGKAKARSSRRPPADAADAFPLNLGRDRALELVREVNAGRRTVVLSADKLTYYGGGVTAYPKDMLHTSITINWPMIEEELAAETAGDLDVALVAVAVLMVKDDVSGIIVSVKPDEQTLVAKDAKGKVLWNVNVIKAAGPPGVGKPAVRHLSIKGGRVTAVYGKHSFAEFDLRTGKLTSSGSD